MAYYKVTDYLDTLLPYINKIRSAKINLSENDKNLLAYLETSFYVPNPQVRSLDVNKNASSNLIYLIEAYMYFYDKNNNNFADINRKYCANIHDGWAIARIIDWDGISFTDYKSSQLPQQSQELIINFNKLLDDDTINKIAILLNRGDEYPELLLDNINIPCNKFYIRIIYKDIDTVIRGDQLSMFVPFFSLTEKIQKQDEPFVNKIQDKETEIKEMVDNTISFSLFNKFIFGLCRE